MGGDTLMANGINGTVRSFAAVIMVVLGALSFIATNGWGVLDRVAYSKEDGARLEERIKALDQKVDQLVQEVRELRRELQQRRPERQ